MDSIMDPLRFRCVGSLSVPPVPRFEAFHAFRSARKVIRMTELFLRAVRSVVEEQVPETTLVAYESLTRLRNEITSQIVPGKVFLAHFLHLLEMPLNEAILLRKDGCNVGYISGEGATRCAVSAEWTTGRGFLDTGWFLNAVSYESGLGDRYHDDPLMRLPSEWLAGTRFITS